MPNDFKKYEKFGTNSLTLLRNYDSQWAYFHETHTCLTTICKEVP